jgi:hypothetical protein
MDELAWRVGLLAAGLLLALAWLASALSRAPKRKSRWRRLQELEGDAGPERARDCDAD